MILSGPEIAAARHRGEIVIDPFDVQQVNPNSYNFRLGNQILVLANAKRERHVTLTSDGLCLIPGEVYLGSTVEVIGSSRYVTTLLGRSSTGRLGLFLNITADLGHCGAISQWTLEMTVIQPLRVYPGMRVGQVAFWLQQGATNQYAGRYHGDQGPQLSRDDKLRGRL